MEYSYILARVDLWNRTWNFKWIVLVVFDVPIRTIILRNVLFSSINVRRYSKNLCYTSLTARCVPKLVLIRYWFYIECDISLFIFWTWTHMPQKKLYIRFSSISVLKQNYSNVTEYVAHPVLINIISICTLTKLFSHNYFQNLDC